MKTLFYISLIVCISCKEKQSQICVGVPENSELFFIIIDTLTFDVESNQYSFEASFVNDVNDDVFFGGYDSYTHSIECYSIKNSQKTQSIALKSGGEPNAINGEISAVLYHNQDSIFLAENGYHEIYLINSKGELQKKWNFFDHKSDLDVKNFTGLYGLGAITKFGMNLFFLNDNKLLTHFAPVTSNDDNMFSLFYSLPPLAILDLDQNVLSKYIGEFPPDYIGEMIPHSLFVSYAVNSEGDVCVLYPSSNYMYSSKSESFLCLKSNFFDPNDQNKYEVSNDVNPDEFYENLEKDGAFQRVLFDQYRNQYYVVVKHPILFPDDDGYYDKYLSGWSLIKFDKNFNLIGECKMDKNKYDYTNIFIVPDGIMVSLENPYNVRNLEDFIEFEIITL